MLPLQLREQVTSDPLMFHDTCYWRLLARRGEACPSHVRYMPAGLVACRCNTNDLYVRTASTASSASCIALLVCCAVVVNFVDSIIVKRLAELNALRDDVCAISYNWNNNNQNSDIYFCSRHCQCAVKEYQRLMFLYYCLFFFFEFAREMLCKPNRMCDSYVTFHWLVGRVLLSTTVLSSAQLYTDCMINTVHKTTCYDWSRHSKLKSKPKN